MKLRLPIIFYVLFLLILPVLVTQVESGTSTNTLYTHAETTTIGGSTYYLHKLSSADGPATTLSQSAATTGRKLMGRWVYPLSGIVSIPASTWTVRYRAMKSSSAFNVVAHGDIDILIRKSDNTIRATIATNVANSASLTLVNVWETLTGTYSWPGYTVVDQTDYLEVAYCIEVTTSQSSKYVRLMVDNGTLPLADQTKIENVIFAYPNQAPVASFTYSPAEPLAEEIVTFNASASYDPDGTIVSYQWDFGDGNVTTVTDPVITHVYVDCGNYTVTLTVTDNEGLASPASQTITVINPALLRLWADAGSYVGSHPDAWINESWVVSSDVPAGGSVSFNLYIDAVSNPCGGYATYYVYLAVAVNDTAQVASITIGSTTITTFTSGTVTWPSVAGGGTLSPHGVYPTSYALAPFGDVASNHDYYTYPGDPYGPYWAYRAYIPVTITTSTAMNAGFKVHFDAQGVLVKGSTKPGHRNTNSFSHDLTSIGAYTPPVTADVVFDQVGVGADFTEAVLTVDGVGYDVGALPKTFTWVVGSEHSFEYHSPLVVDGGKQYVWTHTTGLSTAQSGTIIVPSGGGSVTGHYNSQYLVTFTQNGLDAIATGTVVTVNETALTLVELPYEIWVNESSWISYAYTDIVPTMISGQRFKLVSVTGPSSPFHVTGPVTVTGDYKTQYLVSFTQTGSAVAPTVTYYSDTDPTGTVPFDVWVRAGSEITYTYEDIVPGASGVRYFLTDVTPASPQTVNGPLTIIGTYTTQYLVTFTQNGLDDTATGTIVTVNDIAVTVLPYEIWVNENSWITYSYSDLVGSTTSGKRFKLVGVTGPTSPFHVTEPVTVKGDYKIQYQITVTVSPAGALGGTFKVTYIQCGTTYTDVQKITPWTEWVDGSTTVTVSQPQDIIDVSPDMRYKFDSYSPSSSVHMEQARTITLVYKTQYKITFNQSGVGEDFTDIVVIIDGANYARGALPASFWWGENSVHTFAFQSPLVVTTNAKQYVWTSTTGLSTLQSGSITVSTSGSVTGNYKTQYLLTVRTDPAGLSPQPTRNPAGEAGPANGWWYDPTTSVTLTAQTVTGYTFNYWDVDGISQGSGVNPISVSMNAPHTATAHYTQVPRGGYSISLAKRTSASQIVAYTMLIALFGAALSLTKRKRK